MSTISVERGPVTRITLRRPEQHNALNHQMLSELMEALSTPANEERCVLLAGEGDSFCAGADFGDVAAGIQQGARYGAAFEDLLIAIEDHSTPVIARVHGHALGAGCQILVACDLSIASEDATIGVPSARLGLLLDLEKIERMIRVLGVTPVREMLLSGRNWTGVEAAARGLVTRAVSARELAAETQKLCERVASCAPLSVQGSKAGIRALLRSSAASRSRDEEMFANHDALVIEALRSSDITEGITALRERRPPNFTGA
ncbi:MAG: enoyl-CoA hydratase/isomerase family protein [Actinomycetota bacterium]